MDFRQWAQKKKRETQKLMNSSGRSLTDPYLTAQYWSKKGGKKRGNGGSYPSHKEGPPARPHLGKKEKKEGDTPRPFRHGERSSSTSHPLYLPSDEVEEREEKERMENRRPFARPVKRKRGRPGLLGGWCYASWGDLGGRREGRGRPLTFWMSGKKEQNPPSKPLIAEGRGKGSVPFLEKIAAFIIPLFLRG